MPSQFSYGGDAKSPLDEIALAQWWRTIPDPGLQSVVSAALDQSYDLSEAQLRSSHSAVAGARASGGAAHVAAPRADAYRAEKAAAQLQAARVVLAADAARQYFGILSVATRIDIAIETIEIRERLAQAVQPQIRNDADDALALWQAKELLAEAQVDRIRLTGDYEQRIIGLSHLLGEPVEVTAQRVQGYRLPAELLAEVGAGAPADLPKRRPDVQAALLTLQADNLELTDPFGAWKNRTANANPARAQDARRAARLSALNYERLLHDATVEVERSLLALSTARGELHGVRAAAVAAEVSVRLLAEGGPVGHDALSEILKAERRRYQHRDAEVAVRGRFYTALVNLYESLGGGWLSPAAQAALRDQNQSTTPVAATQQPSAEADR